MLKKALSHPPNPNRAQDTLFPEAAFSPRRNRQRSPLGNGAGLDRLGVGRVKISRLRFLLVCGLAWDKACLGAPGLGG
jgi:hypothetical protein